MVFLIQKHQNRDSQAIPVETGRIDPRQRQGPQRLARHGRTLLEDLDKIRVRYEDLARESREKLRKGHRDTGTPELKNS